MVWLIYVSTATKPFSESGLLTLLNQSRTNNARIGVTGMLLYKDGNFMPALEGEDEDQVRRLYAKICTGPRHKGILTLLQGAEGNRAFPDWSMGFTNLRNLFPIFRESIAFSKAG
jgi:hypothetical protein